MKYTRCSSIWTGFTTALSCSQETTVIVTAAIHWGFDSELRACALTPPLNLPALGRRQPPYVVFTTLRRPVFLVNSRLGHFTATRPETGTPSPEVTGSFCRVPERVFSQAP